jgi:hypothetical protein
MIAIQDHHPHDEAHAEIADPFHRQSREEEIIVIQDLHHRKGAGDIVRKLQNTS